MFSVQCSFGCLFGYIWLCEAQRRREEEKKTITRFGSHENQTTWFNNKNKFFMNRVHIEKWIELKHIFDFEFRFDRLIECILWTMGYEIWVSIEYICAFSIHIILLNMFRFWFFFYSHAFQIIVIIIKCLLTMRQRDACTLWIWNFCNLYICMTFCTLSTNQLHNWLQFVVSFLIIKCLTFWMTEWLDFFNDQWPDVTIL